MPHVLVRHKVHDYAQWREIFDHNIPPREEYGFHEGVIFRNREDPNDITLLFEIDDERKAREFFETDVLLHQMQKAGVAEKPQILFLEALVESPLRY